MKTLIAILMVPMAAVSIDVPLGWIPSPDTGVTNYVIYGSTNVLSSTNLATAEMRFNAGTNLTFTVTNLVPMNYTFAATAMEGGIESGPSNILPVGVPNAPTNLKLIKN